MTPLAVGIAAFVSTMVGGSIALRLRDRLHLILGFSAGAVLAVAFFDLMPEALGLGAARYGIENVIRLMAVGFLLYLLLDRALVMHSHADHEHAQAHKTSRGEMRAGSLSFHSFLDGVGVGLAFQASAPVGFIVAAAVLAHDFSDGINTVNVIVRDGGTYKKALRWLVVDALTPVVGIIVTLFFHVQESTLGLLLALFA
ncbi:MAG TPA: ZIP family metal transporter, partial [Candidatus Paceibacterota bacterium]